MNRLATSTSVVLLTVVLAAPALAHHSAAAFNTQQQVTVTGSVVQYRFANPHVYLTVQVKKDDGSVNTMEVEAGAASVLNGLGFNKDSVKVVTFWGANDAVSWRSNGQPLLFDGDNQPKPAFSAVLRVATQQ